MFSLYHSETEMLRYLRYLQNKDIALDRSMIPLGSCTMKLNATTEMEPVSLPGFADLHPFVPYEDAAGMIELIETLESWLATVTGYAAVSIQPNAGSQGELAGLLAIRAYHRSRGDEHVPCGRTDAAHRLRASGQSGIARRHRVLSELRAILRLCSGCGRKERRNRSTR